MQQPFISDVLLCKIVSSFSAHKLMVHKQLSGRCLYPNKHASEMNSSDLTELLQKSAVEHLTTYRQLEVRDFGSVATFVTTDFEAMYAYKRGDYQRCLQLYTQNVHTLLYADQCLTLPILPTVPILPEFISLLDDDIVSLIALSLIINPKLRNGLYGPSISQLNLSLYLMTQCQLKLRHSVTSLARTLDYIGVARSRYPHDCQLMLLLIERKIKLYDTWL